MTSREQTERNLRRAVVVHNLRTCGGGGVLVAAMLAGLAWAFVLGLRRVTDDMRGATLQRGEALVTGTLLGFGSKANPRQKTVVTLRIGDRSVTLRSDAPVRSGQRVGVTYRVGESGRVYVESIEP